MKKSKLSNAVSKLEQRLQQDEEKKKKMIHPTNLQRAISLIETEQRKNETFKEALIKIIRAMKDTEEQRVIQAEKERDISKDQVRVEASERMQYYSGKQAALLDILNILRKP